MIGLIHRLLARAKIYTLSTDLLPPTLRLKTTVTQFIDLPPRTGIEVGAGGLRGGPSVVVSCVAWNIDYEDSIQQYRAVLEVVGQIGRSAFLIVFFF